MAAPRNRKVRDPLARYVRVIREMHANGWTVDCIVEVALGPGGAPPPPADERPHILAVYREAIGEKVSP